MGLPEEVRKVSRKTLIEGIIKPRLNEIFTMVRLQLDRENISARIPSGVILTGGGAETIGVEDSARKMLSLPVRIGKPSGVAGLIDDIISPQFAVPVGLLLYAKEHESAHQTQPFSRKIKLPSSGFAGKIVDAIKDLLP